MPRKNADGKFIITAGEVGTYSVCPEAWRLLEVEKVKIPGQDSSEKGRELHQAWATNYGESVFLARNAWLISLLALLAALIFALLRHEGY